MAQARREPAWGRPKPTPPAQLQAPLLWGAAAAAASLSSSAVGSVPPARALPSTWGTQSKLPPELFCLFLGSHVAPFPPGSAPPPAQTPKAVRAPELVIFLKRLAAHTPMKFFCAIRKEQEGGGN